MCLCAEGIWCDVGRCVCAEGIWYDGGRCVSVLRVSGVMWVTAGGSLVGCVHLGGSVSREPE